MKTLCLHKGQVFTGIATINDGSIIIKDGLIEDVMSEERLQKKGLPSDCEVIELNGDYVSPGFIDTHVHGSHGFDTAHGNIEDFLGISKNLVRFGVTSFCPTLYPQDERKMLYAIKNGAAAMGLEEGSRINGLHLEGPFVSCKQLGVQRPETIKEVDVGFMRQMYEAGKGAISMMTVAPELKNMRDLALYSVRKGIVLSAGHSDATYENMMEGVQAGILHCTHMFNAMRKLHHRDPGLVGAILIHPDLSCEIIADGVHVHPALVKMLMRDKPDSKILLVTDALGPTGLGADEGPFFANGEEVEMGSDGIWHRKKDGVIAGSCLTMDRAVRNIIEWGASRESAFRMASINPATLLRKESETGYLLPGRKADLVVMKSQNMTVKMTFVDGILKYEA